MLREITPNYLFSSLKQFPDIELSDSRFHDNRLKPLPENHKSVLLFCGFCGSRKMIIQNCGNRQCEYCRSRVVYRTLSRKNLTGHHIKDLRFLTLTIKSVPEIDRNFVLKCRNYLKKFLALPGFRQRVKGGLYVIEITRSLNGYHLHFHIIYEGSYIPYYQIRFSWRKITGDSYVIHIQKIRNLKSTLNYCLNYVTKIDKSNVEPEIYQSCLKRIKLVCFFGAWYRIKSIKVKSRCAHCNCDSWYCEYDVLYGSWRSDDS